MFQSTLLGRRVRMVGAVPPEFADQPIVHQIIDDKRNQVGEIVLVFEDRANSRVGFSIMFEDGRVWTIYNFKLFRILGNEDLGN